VKEPIDLLEDLLLGEDGLLVSLRQGDGLDTEKVDKICNLLECMENKWKDSRLIPKKAAELFVDLCPVMESSCGLYDENEVLEIMDAADRIMVRIRGCLSNAK